MFPERPPGRPFIKQVGYTRPPTSPARSLWSACQGDNSCGLALSCCPTAATAPLQTRPGPAMSPSCQGPRPPPSPSRSPQSVPSPGLLARPGAQDPAEAEQGGRATRPEGSGGGGGAPAVRRAQCGSEVWLCCALAWRTRAGARPLLSVRFPVRKTGAPGLSRRRKEATHAALGSVAAGRLSNRAARRTRWAAPESPGARATPARATPLHGARWGPVGRTEGPSPSSVAQWRR